METKCYKIKILHILNPHFIWIQYYPTGNKQCAFQQVGLYGLLPLDPKVDICNDNLTMRKAKEWAPAATSILISNITESENAWFEPLYKNLGSSLFVNNVHTYGDIIIKKSDGSSVRLTKVLEDTYFSYKDDEVFRELLTSGKIGAKLNEYQTCSMVKALEVIIKTCNNHNQENTLETFRNAVSGVDEDIDIIETKTRDSLKASGKALTPEKELEIIREKKRYYQVYKVDYYTAEERCAIRNKQFCFEIEAMTKEKHDELGVVVTREEDSADLRNKTEKEIADSRNKTEVKSAHSRNKTELSAGSRNKTEVDSAVSRNKTEVVSAVSRNKTEVVSPVSRNKTEVDSAVSRNKTEVVSAVSRNKTEIVSADSRDKTEVESSDTRNKTEVKSVNLRNDKDIKGIKKTTADNNVKDVENIDVKRVSDAYQRRIQVYQKMREMNISAVADTTLNGSSNNQDTDPCKEISLSSSSELDHTSEKAVKNVAKYECVNGSSSQLDVSSAYKGDNVSSVDKDVSNSMFSSNCNLRPIVTSPSLSPLATDKSRLNLFEEVSEEHDHNNGNTSSETTNNTSLIDSRVATSTYQKNYSLSPPKTFIPDQQTADDITSLVDEEFGQKLYVDADKGAANVFENRDATLPSFVDQLIRPVLMVHTKMKRRILPTLMLRDVPFKPEINSALSTMSVKSPMMLQTVSWLSILRGYSIFMISGPGSGKTMGYCPSVCQLVIDYADDPEYTSGAGPICIILCASASSVVNVVKKCNRFLGHKNTVLSCYAGINEKEVITLLLNGCDIFVCTPCSLVRLFNYSSFSIDIERLAVCVLDDCERLNEVYMDEVKYFLSRIKDMVAKRMDKSKAVQYIVSSRIWCDFMRPLAKIAPFSMVCIGAYQECVLYSQALTSLSCIQGANKVKAALDFVNDIDSSKRTIVVCTTTEEVESLTRALEQLNYVVFSADDNMTVETLHKLNSDWWGYQEPLLGPILVCCDGNLSHLNITNAHHLLHFSLPLLFSTFCKRFSTLTDSYISIYAEESKSAVKIKILVEESNVMQLPKIIHFVERWSNNVPKVLIELYKESLKQRDNLKAQNHISICNRLLSFGECPDFWNCTARHSLFKNFDTPQEWVPTSGNITFVILHYVDAVTYSVRLLTNKVNEETTKFAPNHFSLPLKMLTYYANKNNRIPLGIPKMGDICAVSIKPNQFERCEVTKIISTGRRGNPYNVVIKLIDEEQSERVRDVDLYAMPEHLKSVRTHVARVKLGGLQPKDKDLMFSDLATKHLINQIEGDNLFMRANVIMTVGNTIIVDGVEVCHELPSLNLTVVRYNFKTLLQSHAIENKDYVLKLQQLCDKSDFELKDREENTIATAGTNAALPSPQWAYFDGGDNNLVYFTSAEDPSEFFVRLVKFNDCLDTLTKKIQKYISEEDVKPPLNVTEGDLVLALFPDDSLYYRARVDNLIDNGKVKCFFVDHGDWRFVNRQNITRMTSMFITLLPFQAIECRLVGVQPPGETWSDFSTNRFCDLCFLGQSDELKMLYLQYYVKETSKHTNGHKYAVTLIDTTASYDVILNQALLDGQFAWPVESEIHYLDDIKKICVAKKPGSSESEEENWEVETMPCLDNHHQLVLKDGANLGKSILDNKLIRSVPLVGSDDNDSDWDCNIDSILENFKMVPSSLQDQQMSDSLASVDLEICNTPNVTTPDSFINVEVNKSPALFKKDNTITPNVTTPDSFINVEADGSPAMVKKKNTLTPNVTTPDSFINIEVNKSPALIKKENTITPNVTTPDSFINVEADGSPAMVKEKNTLTPNVTTPDSFINIEVNKSPALIKKENTITPNVTTPDSFINVDADGSPALVKKKNTLSPNVTTPDSFINVEVNKSPALFKKDNTITPNVTTPDSFINVEADGSPAMVKKKNTLTPNVTTPEVNKSPALMKKDNTITPNVTTPDGFIKVEANDGPAMGVKENTVTIKSNTGRQSLKINEVDSDVNGSSSGREIPTAMALLPKRNLHREPKLVWHQTTSTVFIKVTVYGVEQYKFSISGERKLKFSTKVRNITYAFDLELYGAINSSKSSHAKKGLYVTMRLAKRMHFEWANLFAGDEKRNWAVYNPDMIDTSSEDDLEDIERTKESVLNMVRDDRNDTDLESVRSFDDEMLN